MHPLESFQLDSKAGYCQHFSGAMALLLRMGGIPTRVVTGFSPGGYSKSKRAWIVRDTDAHSWVDVVRGFVPRGDEVHDELVASARRGQNSPHVARDKAADLLYAELREQEFYVLPDDRSGMPTSCRSRSRRGSCN